jgi:guanylate kinase
MAKIYVIMGKSSTGKDTIYKHLKEMPESEFNTVTMYTTRPLRQGESNGREYFFTTEEELKKYEEDGKIIELRAYNTVHGVWKYFTLDDGQINLESDNKYLIIATLEAYRKYLEYYGKEVVVPIYIEVEDSIRIHRAISREDAQDAPKYAEMCRRYLADEEDFSEENIKALGITKRYFNHDLEKCINDIMADVTSF